MLFCLIRDFSTVLRDIPPTGSSVVRLNTIGNNLNVYDDPVGHVNSAFDSTDFEVVNNDEQEDEEEAEEEIVSHIQPFSRLDVVTDEENLPNKAKLLVHL